MRLIALLCWYDEPAWCLAELVASLARSDVDEIVAVDGAYALFPGGRPRSRSDQSHAIMAAARGAGMGVTLHSPRDLWLGNEVEKRSFLFAAGHLVGGPNDWFWVVDADEVVTEAVGLRAALERTPHDAGEVVLDQITADGPQCQLLMRMLFRYQATGIRCDGNHYTYMTGDGRMLWQGNIGTHPLLEPAEPLHFVRVAHQQTGRSHERERARESYYRARKETGAELEAVR